MSMPNSLITDKNLVFVSEEINYKQDQIKNKGDLEMHGVVRLKIEHKNIHRYLQEYTC